MTAEPGPALRPQLARSAARGDPDSGLFASYYFGDAATSYPSNSSSPRRERNRTLSDAASTSSSDYSDGQGEEDSSDDDKSKEPPPQATRRSSVPSQGGADRRRLAIVELDSKPRRMEAVPESSKAATSTANARRGAARLDGIALVAPPDSDARKYAYVEPPLSAPATPQSMAELQEQSTSHHRSTSEASSKASRDVGVVGTHPDSPRKLRIDIGGASKSLMPPVFQEPHASPVSTPNSGPPGRTDTSVHTPELGQAKDIHVPVAAPVVVDLGLEPSLSPTMARDYSAYLNYEPGVHSTAGPLPAPPRAAFTSTSSSSTPPPPRPPRLHSPPPNRRDNALLPGVSAVINSSGSNTPSSSNSRSVSPARPLSSDDSSNDETHHRREGAFPPSVLITTPSTSLSDYSPPSTRAHRSINDMIAEEVKPPAAEPEILPTVALVKTKPAATEEWTHISRDLTASPPSSDDHASVDARSWESFSQDGFNPTTQARTSFKSSLTNGLKRISSLSGSPAKRRSLSLTRSSSPRSHSSPTTRPVPLPPATSGSTSASQRAVPLTKIIEQYPAALFSADISSRKTSAERCAFYAQKINELYIHDSGLGEWLVDLQFRGSNAGKGPQPRHVSHGSVKSQATQATFPLRADAMVATDLTTRAIDIAPATGPPLPYPALSPRSVASALPANMRMLAVSPGKTGFFSSLGRKGSVNKRSDTKPVGFSLGTAATTTRLVKSPPPASRAAPSPPVVAISSTQSVPGGPRAPPNRALMNLSRAQKTQSISPPFSPNAASVAAARRPSLFTPTNSSSSSSTGNSSDHGNKRVLDNQIDRLQDLLPHAERGVLAGYLRRAGQDMLAIGQYLEDEKNGTLRRD
uniref:Uncharacterized protein n=1 Tax=Mycena chlorophos TaxID=658473 RepID=A0ABQ0LTC2_MYCCL|nr:predicted protein [Mycena chlorophos]